MEEFYIEGVAVHGGPESCGVVREGGGVALVQVPDRVFNAAMKRGVGVYHVPQLIHRNARVDS